LRIGARESDAMNFGIVEAQALTVDGDELLDSVDEQKIWML